jgi:hypothetical protein
MIMDEEEQARAEADKYFEDNHKKKSDGESHEGENHTIYSSIAKTASGESESETKNKQDKSNEAALYGGAAGAYAAHTDAFRRTAGKLLKPAPTLYAPSAPKTTASTAARPRPATGMRIEPTFGAPGAATEASQVDQMMQSIKGEGKPTGRQMERGHNWETNRESLATKHNLKTPGAPQAIVEAGPMAPTRAGIAVPESVAREMEEEALRREAARRVAEQNAKAAADARAAQEAEVAAQAEARAADKTARRSAQVGAAKGFGKVALGGLGGALSAKEAYDLYQEGLHKKPMSEWTDEDYARAMTAAGGLSMTVPTIPTQLLGGLATGAGMAYPYVAPKVRRLFGSK